MEKNSCKYLMDITGDVGRYSSEFIYFSIQFTFNVGYIQIEIVHNIFWKINFFCDSTNDLLYNEYLKKKFFQPLM